MDDAKSAEIPHPVCSSTRHYTAAYSGNWAGDTGPNTDYDNQSFQTTESAWTQPEVGNNSKYTSYKAAPDASLWTGIGSTSIIQAGCDSISTSTAQYKCWTEDYPQGTDWEGPVVDAGDEVYVSVQRISSGSNASYYIENESTGAYQSFENSAPDYDGTTADFILERLEGSGSGDYYLPNFGSTTQSGSFESWSGNWYSITAGDNDLYTMTSNCKSSGIVLAQPGAIHSGEFTQNTYASSPVCNG